MKMWYIVDLILTMNAVCVWRASCVSALFRQALDVLEVDALRVCTSRKEPRDLTSLHFSLVNVGSDYKLTDQLSPMIYSQCYLTAPCR